MRLVQESPGEKITTSVIYIDAAMAQRVLAKNTHNRPLSERNIQQLHHEMISGRWVYNGETIKWSENDELLDGQHRLHAVARTEGTGLKFPFLVVRGLPSEAQATMDQGRKRTAGDQLHLAGVVKSDMDAKTIAAAVRVYLEWTQGLIFGDRVSNKVSNPEVIQWSLRNLESVWLMQSIINTDMKRVKVRPAITLAVLYVFASLDEQACADFTHSLYTGAGLHIGHPILTLRTRLDRIKESRIKTSDRDYIAYFVTTWNAWREGRTLAKLQRPDGAAYTRDNFPEPK